jgi:multidrug efflux pump subunit AcrA (membrane-fusion protein)
LVVAPALDSDSLDRIAELEAELAQARASAASWQSAYELEKEQVRGGIALHEANKQRIAELEAELAEVEAVLMRAYFDLRYRLRKTQDA